VYHKLAVAAAARFSLTIPHDTAKLHHHDELQQPKLSYNAFSQFFVVFS
jgi:hypothetical protein